MLEFNIYREYINLGWFLKIFLVKRKNKYGENYLKLINLNEC